MSEKIGKFFGYTGAFIVVTFVSLGIATVTGAYCRFVFEAVKLGWRLGR